MTAPYYGEPTHTAGSPTPVKPSGTLAAVPPPPPPGTNQYPSPPPVLPALTQNQQSVWDFIRATLTSWGIPDSLMGDVRSFIVAGYGSDEIQLKLQETQAYKDRFAGNELRRKAGLPVLSPAQYIALEEAYTSTLRAYGLPPGFYDDKRDFDQFIGNDIDPTELRERAQAAHDQYMQAPEEYRQQWRDNYGNDGDAIAYILDPTKAQSAVLNRMRQVAIGGEARLKGLTIDAQRAQQFDQRGVTLEQARRAYSQIAQIRGTDAAIAGRFGTTFTQQDEEDELLLGSAEVAEKRRRLYGQEEALFRARPGVAENAIGVSQSNY